jgi:hypothetical protein
VAGSVPRPAATPPTQPTASAASTSPASTTSPAQAPSPAPAAPVAPTRPLPEPSPARDGAPQAPRSAPTGPAPTGGTQTNGHADRGMGCTAPQLRRFIKSRPYVPMHELRRRFAIDGTDDDVTPVALDAGRIFVGLPAREGALLGELLRGGEVGFELSLDPRTPVVIGVYPMRPIPRA